MALTQQQRETWTYAVTQLVGLFLLAVTLLIPLRTKVLVLSPRFVPLVVTIVFNVISLVCLIKSIREGGNLRLSTLWAAIRDAAKAPHLRRTFVTIAMVALYIFVGVRFLGYYLSSFALMLAVLVFYLRRRRSVWYIAAILAFVGILYAIFALLFRIPLR